MTTWRAVGFNERLRFLRYDPGTYFAPHMDGSYERDDPSHPKYGEKSLVTAQIYLNQGFEGGATRMMGRNLSDGYDVVPRTGSVLVFQHDIFHEGSVLIAGRKYTIRTDVMYARSS
jgi:predicted 2-oxoglutarate/Fe(II)-dependent dioxygenase YbiX